MKKNNKLMRASSILLVLTLITSCFVGGTFAKYVTTKEATDTARVAKWGVDVTVTGGAFKTDYNADDPMNYTLNPVVSSTTEVVAPGTNGSLGGVEISGTPEVAVDVTVTSKFDLSDNWTVNTTGSDEFYCPIVIDVSGTQFCGLKYASAELFENDVNKYITDTYSEQCRAKTELESSVKARDLNVKWRWVFDTTKVDSTTGFDLDPEIKSLIQQKQTDAKDTALGDKADDEELKITLGLETTVTQLD